MEELFYFVNRGNYFVDRLSEATFHTGYFCGVCRICRLLSVGYFGYLSPKEREEGSVMRCVVANECYICDCNWDRGALYRRVDSRKLFSLQSFSVPYLAMGV